MIFDEIQLNTLYRLINLIKQSHRFVNRLESPGDCGWKQERGEAGKNESDVLEQGRKGESVVCRMLTEQPIFALELRGVDSA
jgi:hypothetical protein